MQDPTPHRRVVRRRKKKRGIYLIPRWIRRLITLALLVVLFFAALFGGLSAFNRLSIFQADPLSYFTGQDRENEAEARAAKNIHLLLIGSDEREEENARSDTMMYLVLRPTEHKASILSLPRDTLVAIPDVGEDKLNHAYAYGGSDLLKETVENFLNSPVDHIVHVNFQSFEKVIDAMGGITIDVETDMYLPEENIDLKQGTQTLSGYDALAYVRWRGDGLGDLGRIERQQKFMHAASAKMRHLPPWRLAKVAHILTQDIKTDLSIKDCLRMAIPYVGVGKDALETYHLEGEPVYIGGISYLRVTKSDARDVAQRMNYGDIDIHDKDQGGWKHGIGTRNTD